MNENNDYLIYQNLIKIISDHKIFVKSAVFEELKQPNAINIKVRKS